MPTYSFIDTDTEEEFEIFMSMSDREEFLKENPSVKPIMLSAPALVRGTNSNNKVPDGFKEVLSKVAESHKGSSVGEKHYKRSIKETKTKRVVDSLYKKKYGK